MSDELRWEVALEMAGALSTIDEFPRNHGAMRATAEDLVRWCKGAFLEGLAWSAEAQASWLVETARETFTKWPGTAALKQLFHDKFSKRVLPREQETEFVNRGPICALCSGTGWRIIERNGTSGAARCSCHQSGPEILAPEVCRICKGKETILVDGRRRECSCVTPERREQLRQIAAATRPKPAPRAPQPLLPAGMMPITADDVEAELIRLGRKRLQ